MQLCNRCATVSNALALHHFSFAASDRVVVRFESSAGLQIAPVWSNTLDRFTRIVVYSALLLVPALAATQCANTKKKKRENQARAASVEGRRGANGARGSGRADAGRERHARARDAGLPSDPSDPTAAEERRRNEARAEEQGPEDLHGTRARDPSLQNPHHPGEVGREGQKVSYLTRFRDFWGVRREIWWVGEEARCE
ncbi:hypothetical protein L596_016690 [Steinernema carpocapsae]|uniref:Uncharacterized protein n=1 Tax=Steinernema carpocapsae TaxID=34508 RepID=A0A4U5NJH6_STECR|nr:hypothetical protein L596_016690 [Steinernema carpocapsae]